MSELVWVGNIGREGLDCTIPARGASAVSTLCPQDPGTSLGESGVGAATGLLRTPQGVGLTKRDSALTFQSQLCSG